MKRDSIVKISSILFFIIILSVIFELSGLRQNFNLDFLRSMIAANIFSGVLIFILMFSIGNLIQIPGWIFLAAAVMTLGKVTGGFITYIAAVSSCLITYGLIGVLGQDALRGLESPLAQRLFKKLDTHPVSAIIGLRVIFQTVPVLNYALALSGIKFRHYFIGTLVGLPLPIFLYCVFFDVLAKHVFHISL